ncbi:MAG: phage portal protein [Bacteroidales bacterium]|nr:phage portal protein [Bacteroidales bacterium]
MKTIEEIFADGNTPDKIVGILTGQQKDCPKWEVLEPFFDMRKHPVVADPTRRPKTKTKGGQREVPAKLLYPAEQIAARRMTQMAFSIPVKRLYSKPQNEDEKAFQRSIEKVYDAVRINGVNAKRMYAYFASCEVCTFWYVVEGTVEHEKYGFNTTDKIRCRSFSPMPKKFSGIRQADIYPYFDDMDDLIVLSVRYKDAENVEHFDAYTAEKAYYYERGGSSAKWQVNDVENPLEKIPAMYLTRSLPVYYGISEDRDDIEFTISRSSDNIRKNSTPILKIKGKLQGEMPVGDTARQVYQLENDGDLDLVSPVLTTQDAKTHVGMLKEIIQETTQLPDLSLENIKGIGAQSGEARKTLLMDPHLKVGDESHDIIWALDREFEIVKAIICNMHPEWKPYQYTTTCRQKITPFIQNDRTTDIDNFSKASGVLMSQKSAFEQADLVEDPEADYQQYLAETAQKAEAERMVNVFEAAE